MNRAALIILDGWGIGDGGPDDAISQAKTPVYDNLLNSCSHSKLKTYGEHVGLPSGQMGNSEVGHLNIGAGRIVHQDLARINQAMLDGSLAENTVLKQAILSANRSGGIIHLIGLVSHGGVHSSQKHLHALIEILEVKTNQPIFIHAFTDGRDTEPKSAKENIVELEVFLSGRKTKLVSMIGRYYAMDRDKRWERTKIAYDLLCKREGRLVDSFVAECERSYADNITDEFFEPSCSAEIDGRVKPGDTVICFNFRTDRCRQITEVLTQRTIDDYNMHTLPLNYITMTRYDQSFEGVRVMFDKPNLTNTLGEVVSAAGGTQLRIAETEKYPHVTFFFSGGREQIFKGEKRKMAASPKVATYDLQPEMSANEVKEMCIESIEQDKPDFICLNFANPDMVGHTGVFTAIVNAVETVDKYLGEVLNKLAEQNYQAIIIADHGNADLTKLPDGTPHTAHTTNPVPCILFGSQNKLRDGILADVAPTILQIMGLDKPEEMSGSTLMQ